MLNRRETITGLLLASGLAGKGVCAGDDELHSRVAAHVRGMKLDRSIPLQLLIPAGSGASLRPVVADFKNRTGVTCALHEVDAETISSQLLLARMSGDGLYDVALPATFALPDLVVADAIEPLDRFRSSHEPDGFRQDILYGIGDDFEGSTYGFQTDGDAYLMFYNRDMLDNPAARKRYADTFGEPLGVPATWQELDRQMGFFHNPDEGRFGGSLFRIPGYVAWEWWVRLHAKGVWPLSAEMVPQIARDAGVSALEDMIRASDSLCPKVWDLGLFENWDRFGQGDIYCNLGWGGMQKHLNRPQSAMKDRLAFGPTPGGLIDGELLITPYFNWGWNYVVTTSCDRPELAYLFCLFAASPVMSTMAVRQAESFFDPFRPEHYHDPGIIDAYSPPFLEVQRSSLETAIPDFYLRGQSEYFRILNDALFQALSGEKTPAKALSETAELWELITSRFGRDAQIARWAELRAKYPPRARLLLRDLA